MTYFSVASQQMHNCLMIDGVLVYISTHLTVPELSTRTLLRWIGVKKSRLQIVEEWKNLFGFRYKQSVVVLDQIRHPWPGLSKCGCQWRERSKSWIFIGLSSSQCLYDNNNCSSQQASSRLTKDAEQYVTFHHYFQTFLLINHWW